ncbi:MAG: shikimate kinase [Synechococcus sp.]|nr:shikimate kinase [Synechococcus sp.]
MSVQPQNGPHPLRHRLGGRNLYLVGMMGSGKTSSGRPLAEQLGYGFVDADAVIEQVAGCSIPTIFSEEGEEGFRTLEAQVLQAIGQRHSLVVATGGGVVTKPQNWGVLHQGVVIWLDPGQDRILARLEHDTTERPLLQTDDPGAALQALLLERSPLYGEADLHLKVHDQTPAEVAAMVLEAIPSILRPASEAPGAPQTTGG